VNTAKKEVSSALFYTLTASDIEQLVEGPYKDQASLTQKLQGLAAGKQLPQAFYNVKSSYFEVTVDTLFGRYRRTTQSLIVRPGGKGRNSGALAQPAPADKHRRPHYYFHRYFHRKLHSNVGRKDIMMRDALMG
jgi:hypothetical protein